MKLTLGERFTIYRMRSGLTKKVLAEKAFPGLAAPQMKIQKIENSSQIPSDEEAKAIASALGITVSDLIGVAPDERVNGRIHVPEKTLTAIPKLRVYLKVLISMADLQDDVLLKTTISSMCRELREEERRTN